MKAVGQDTLDAALHLASGAEMKALEDSGPEAGAGQPRADAADDTGPHTWRVLCLDRDTGKILWTKTAHEGTPKLKRHVTGSQANGTPAADGQAANGKEVYRERIGGNADTASPVAADGRLHFASGQGDVRV